MVVLSSCLHRVTNSFKGQYVYYKITANVRNLSFTKFKTIVNQKLHAKSFISVHFLKILGTVWLFQVVFTYEIYLYNVKIIKLKQIYIKEQPEFLARTSLGESALRMTIISSNILI